MLLNRSKTSNQFFCILLVSIAAKDKTIYYNTCCTYLVNYSKLNFPFLDLHFLNLLFNQN